MEKLRDRWKNRRMMAWLALIAGLLFPLLVLFTDSTELGALATAFYIFVSAVVGAYMGFATMDDKYTAERDDRMYNPQSNRSYPPNMNPGVADHRDIQTNYEG